MAARRPRPARRRGRERALARSVDSTGGVYFVPALAGLGSPHWDADARGLISGLTRGTTRAHLVRAALEAIAFQVADVLEVLPGGVDVLRADGGASANGFLMQFQADLLGCPVEVAAERETTALGAAALAGRGDRALARRRRDPCDCSAGRGLRAGGRPGHCCRPAGRVAQALNRALLGAATLPLLRSAKRAVK